MILTNLNPERLADESFEAYKKRRAEGHAAAKAAIGPEPTLTFLHRTGSEKGKYPKEYTKGTIRVFKLAKRIHRKGEQKPFSD